MTTCADYTDAPVVRSSSRRVHKSLKLFLNLVFCPSHGRGRRRIRLVREVHAETVAEQLKCRELPDELGVSVRRYCRKDEAPCRCRGAVRRNNPVRTRPATCATAE